MVNATDFLSEEAYYLALREEDDERWAATELDNLNARRAGTGRLRRPLG